MRNIEGERANVKVEKNCLFVHEKERGVGERNEKDKNEERSGERERERVQGKREG